MEANRLWQGLERELGADIEWVQGGNLALAADEARMARFEAWLPVAREFGLDRRVCCAPRELDAVVPGLAGGWAGGLHTPERRPRRSREGAPTPSRARPSRTGRACTSGARCRA